MTRRYCAYVVGDAGHIRNRIEIPCDNDEEPQLQSDLLVDGRGASDCDLRIQRAAGAVRRVSTKVYIAGQWTTDGASRPPTRT
jgi:hypothetical protein